MLQQQQQQIPASKVVVLGRTQFESSKFEIFKKV